MQVINKTVHRAIKFEQHVPKAFKVKTEQHALNSNRQINNGLQNINTFKRHLGERKPQNYYQPKTRHRLE